MVKVETEKLLKKSLVMLSGDEFALRARALKDLSTAATGGDDFDIETFVADASSPQQWLASVGTSPFLSPRRTVVVRNLCRSDGHKEFRACQLPAHAMLILVADDEAGDFDRQRRMDASRAAWEKAVTAAGGEVLKLSVEPKEVSRQTKLAAEALGKKISDRTVEALVEMTGSSLSRAEEELEKLVLYVGDQTEITERDVRVLAIPSPEWNVYRLLDAIVRADHGAALRQLKILVGNSPKVEDIIFRTIFPTLNTQFRLLWQARACIEAKVSPAAAPASLTSVMPEKPNFFKEADWKQNRAMQTARKLDFRAQARCLAAISMADARLKGLLPYFEPGDTLERMVLEMIQPASPES